ncbi:MAG TPA: phosphate acyltransferase PlsX [Clostridiales bacterium]|nr:phosphate acyltransferase PlsX [Clostridiales bacterium]
MRIAVDGYGGDNAPQEVVKGVLAALDADKDIEILLTGKKEELAALAGAHDRLTILDAEEVISCEETPVVAVRTKKNSSLVVALDAVKTGQADGLVSAGSTGAVLIGATLYIGRVKGVERPALAPALPTVKGGNVILCDCGANVDCRPSYLLGFARMAVAYQKGVFGLENPRVGLLNNGAEETKGNAFSVECHGLLKAASGINFVGNVEARDILSGEVDVVVADGFDGNVALKSAEGTANAVFSLLKQGIYAGGTRAKLGALLLKPVFKGLKKKLDYNEHGGAAFLGLKKPVVKAHGASKAKSVCGAILQVRDMIAGKVSERLAKDVGND